jgi:hypothetical protein
MEVYHHTEDRILHGFHPNLEALASRFCACEDHTAKAVSSPLDVD